MRSHFCSLIITLPPLCKYYSFFLSFQDVAGGGKPSFLITNYALTMMMLFYLMCRNDPIIPSVNCLRSSWAGHVPVFIGPWDVGFGTNVNEWLHRFHNVNIMELVSEFFSYFGKLEASKWIISPFVGMLLDKRDVGIRSRNLPQCLDTFLQNCDGMKLISPLHVQDPFEHCHNCTKGLSETSLFEFQAKCRKAALICNGILKGEQTLNDLFQPIEMTTDLMRDVFQTSSQSDDNEVITLDDSDLLNDSQESTSSTTEQDVEVLADSKNTPDVEILPSPKKPVEEIILDPQEDQDIEILSCHEETIDSLKTRQKSEAKSESFRNLSDHSASHSHDSAVLSEHKQVCNKRTEVSLIEGEGNSLSEANTDSNGVMYPVVVHQLEKCSSFFLDYSQVPGFKITPNGDILRYGDNLFDDNGIGQAACALVQFALKQCLKVELMTTEKSLSDEKTNEKRKAILQGDNNTSQKRMKSEDGKSDSLPAKYLRISKYKCLATQELWKGRKKISKKLARRLNESPLQYEIAITKAQIEQLTNSPENCTLDFTIEVWQELDNPTSIHVTGVASQSKVIQGLMIPMFTYFTSLCRNLLKKLTHYVKYGQQESKT